MFLQQEICTNAIDVVNSVEKNSEEMRSGITEEAKSVVAAAATAVVMVTMSYCLLLLGRSSSRCAVQDFQKELRRIVLGGRDFGNVLEADVILSDQIVGRCRC